MNPPYLAIGLRLTVVRGALGINQAELCRRIKVDPPRWNQYELGHRRITLEVALRLRAVFGITLDWIYIGDPSSLPAKLHQQILLAG
jgi:transcriptional regulator with XRE-family HTH domain